MVKLILRGSILALLGVVAAASAVAGNMSVKPSTTPKITSVSAISTARTQTITIKGTGFGTFGGCHYCDSPFIWLRELKSNGNPSDVLWEAGYSPDKDTVTIWIKSWTNTEIVLGGFGPAWGKNHWTLVKGNVEQIRVWNWEGNPPSSPSAIVKVKIQ